ncbi:MAG: RNA polymerase sigma factor [Saprospiraceae bacterium]|nr:RNA polymerase sigma factor [Saprospiraceae bacterium]MCB9322226.1 RNA polymerase sigma factor [Lewinellaceae bacterium]
MSQDFFTASILPIKNKLYRFALSITSDTTEAEDIVQEVLVKIWQKKQEWDQISNMEAWCMRMTRNLSIDKLRSKHKKVVELDVTYNGSDNHTPENIMQTKDTLLHIKKLMEELPEKQRSAMQLRDIEDYSYQEISDALDIPLSQVKIYLFRARTAIRQKMLKSSLYE